MTEIPDSDLLGRVQRPELFIREFNFVSHAASRTGEGFDVNHDTYFVGGAALGVFDGMGSKPGAVEAAQAASVSMEATLEAISPQTIDEAEELMSAALGYAHSAALGSSGKTSASAVKLWSPDNRPFITVGNVGDSNVFIMRDGKLTQITHEETRGAEEEFWAHVGGLATCAANAKELADLVAKNKHRIQGSADTTNIARRYFKDYRHLAFSMLGGQPRSTISTHELQKGDKVVLLSDGITDPLTRPALTELLNGSSAAFAPGLLIDVAGAVESEDRRKKDDRTAIVAEIV